MLDVDDLAKQTLGLFKCRHYSWYYYCSGPIRPVSVKHFRQVLSELD